MSTYRQTIFRLLLAVITVIALLSCSRPSDESQIRSALSAMVEAVEAHDRHGVLAYLSENFRAGQQRRRADINRLMLFYFRQHKNISIYLSDETIQVDSQQADVQFNALVTGAEGLIPNAARAYQVKMRWRKLDGVWKLSRLNWQAEP